MIYCGVVETHSIHLHHHDDLDTIYSIDLITSKHEPKFYVYGFDGEEEWLWEFWYASVTSYDKVKWCIMDVAHEADNIKDLLYELNDIFCSVFEDLLVQDEDVRFEKSNSLLN